MMHAYDHNIHPIRLNASHGNRHIQTYFLCLKLLIGITDKFRQRLPKQRVRVIYSNSNHVTFPFFYIYSSLANIINFIQFYSP